MEYNIRVSGELPGTCHVEYEEQQIPASTKKVAKVVCGNGKLVAQEEHVS